MPINLKRLAIVTTVFTGTKVWHNDAEILAYCQSKMGGNWTDIRQIRTNQAELKAVCADDFSAVWAEVINAEGNGEMIDTPKPYPDAEQLHNSNAAMIDAVIDVKGNGLYTAVLDLDDDILGNIQQYADSKGKSVAECIEEVVKEKFGKPIAIKAEI